MWHIFSSVSLRHALLGFLSLRHLTGYDLKKYFDSSIRHLWSADQAQIYRTLAQLADDGQVEVEVIPQSGRPNRREHRITAAGAAALDAWLHRVDEPPPAREPLPVKIFFAGRLPPDELIELIEAHITAAQHRINELQQISHDVLATLPAGPPTPVRLMTIATVEYRIRHLLTDLVWLQNLRRDVEDSSTMQPRSWRHMRLSLPD